MSEGRPRRGDRKEALEIAEKLRLTLIDFAEKFCDHRAIGRVYDIAWDKEYFKHWLGLVDKKKLH